ncbi:MAG: hypothetical protein A4E53_00121 [Pelotomaculum sp. PtaB.Bin104]|nr:MAG: hypothetical protein A4E53_00121 [Pelotomaculum sp. PtaB.Bin104]
MKELILDNRGVFSVFFMMIISLMILILISDVEIPRDKHGSDIDLQKAIEQAAYAAANGVDTTSQANNTPYVDPVKAHAYFRHFLAKNLLLDDVTLEPLGNSGLKSAPQYELLIVNGNNPYVSKGYFYDSQASEGYVDVDIPITLGIDEDGIDLSGAGYRQTTIKSPSCVTHIKAELKEVIAENGNREAIRWAVGRLVTH